MKNKTGSLPQTRTYKIVMIFEDVVHTHFMQAADVFEKFKVLGSFEEFDAKTTGPWTEEMIVQHYKNAVEKTDSSKYRVVAIFIPGHPASAWFDPVVKVVSNGRGWITVGDIRKQYHLDV